MKTALRVTAVVTMAVLTSACESAGIPQCDNYANPAQVDRCYASNIQQVAPLVDSYYSGGHLGWNIDGDERSYAWANGGWREYLASKCSGDKRCEWDYYNAEYRKVQAKLAAWKSGSIDLVKEFKDNMKAGRRPFTTDTKLPALKLPPQVAKAVQTPPKVVQTGSATTASNIIPNGQPKPFPKIPDAEILPCAHFDGSVSQTTFYSEPNGQVLHTLKPDRHFYAAVASIKNGWGRIVYANHSRKPDTPNGETLAYVKISEIRYSESGCDKVTTNDIVTGD